MAAAEQDGGRGSRRAVTDPIEMANGRTDDDFMGDYLPTLEQSKEWAHPKTGIKYNLVFLRSSALTEEQVDACFHLIDETSGSDYRSSSVGWHPAMKKKEMRSPDLRYILVQSGDDVRGFTSMMPTYENGEAVIYCYEIHLKDDLQGTGLGKQMMNYLIEAGNSISSVAKVMLTCFVSNERAWQFYEKMGFAVDESSPRERKLRGGKVVVPDYVIMSRRTTSTPRRRKKHE